MREYEEPFQWWEDAMVVNTYSRNSVNKDDRMEVDFYPGEYREAADITFLPLYMVPLL